MHREAPSVVGAGWLRSPGMARVGPFLLTELIARGGMGEVWRALHTGTQVPAAIKLLRADAERWRSAFRAEILAVAQLDHPGIAYVFDHGEVSEDEANAPERAAELRRGQPWMAMELCSGGTLRGFYPTNWNQLRRILLDVLDGLAHAHAHGVLHRDLKPENVLVAVSPDLWPGRKLADFGLAFMEEVEGAVIGTPAYMAPEQFRRAAYEYGPWTDLYALGCLAWTLTTGAPPFGENRPASVLAAAHAEVPPPAFRPRFTVPEGLGDWMLRLLEKRPERRIPHAADAIAALMNVDGSRPPGGRLQQQAPGSSSRTVSPAALASGLGLLAHRRPPMLGRQFERERLLTALSDVERAWDLRVVVLEGAAGLGKTRLAAWLAERAEEVGGATVLSAEHQEDDHGALARLLARHLRCEGLNLAAAEERIGTLLRARGEADPAERHALAALIARGGTAETRRWSTEERHAAVWRHLLRLAAERPVLVWLDDIHYGADSLVFVQNLIQAREAHSLPVLVVLGVRTETLADRPAEAALLAEILSSPVARRIEVGPMSAPDILLLAREGLGLDAVLAETLSRKSGGNPAFLLTVLQDQIQRGQLRATPEGVVHVGGQLDLPAELQAVWSARLDRALDPGQQGRDVYAERRVLEVAAVLGDDVKTGDWTEACAWLGLTIPPALVPSLEAGDLIVRQREGWAFSSTLLRECLEQSALAAGRRGQIHFACAEVLRRRSPVDAEALAGHLLGAAADGEVEPSEIEHAAVIALESAATDRVIRGEPRVALELLRRAEAVMAAAQVSASDARWGALWCTAGDVKRGAGQYEAARVSAARAVRAATRQGWISILPGALLLLAETTRMRGRLADAVGTYHQAHAAYNARGDAQGASRALLGMATLAAEMGETAQSLRLLQPLFGTEGRLGADVLRTQADAQRRAGEFVSAELCAEEAYLAYRRLGHVGGQAAALTIHASILRSAGDLLGAEPRAAEALRLCDARGSRHVIFPLIALGIILVSTHRTQDARRLAERALRLAEAQGRDALSAAAHTVILAAIAGGEDPEDLDHHLISAARLLEATDTVDPDLGDVLILAATDLGDRGRAEMVWRLARAQWAALGWRAKLALCDEALGA